MSAAPPLRLTVLGSGDAFSGAGCNATAALDGRVLVDCGAPLHVTGRRAGIDVQSIDLLLVTHFHADHVFMLPHLLGARALVGEPRPGLVIAGPAGTAEYIERLVSAGFGSNFHELITNTVRPGFVVLQDGSDVGLCGYRVRAHAVVHSTGPSLAYAVSRDGTTVGFTGDTVDCAGLWRLASSVDALVCECSGMDGEVPGGHLTRTDVERLVAARPEMPVVVMHVPRRDTIKGAIVAHDLLTLEIS